MMDVNPNHRTGILVALAFLLWLPSGSLDAQAVVVSGGPERAEVEAGGPPVRIELSGKGLDRIRSVQAVRRGEPVRGVEVKLLEAMGAALSMEVVADVVPGATEGITLLLSGPEGQVEVPVDIRVVSSAPVLRGLQAPPSVTGEGTASLAVVIDRPAARGGLSVTLSSSDSQILSVPREVWIPGGETAAKAELQVNPSARATSVRITGSTTTGLVETVILVEALASVTFEPVPVRTQDLYFTGRRFAPVSVGVTPMRFTGRRFTPVTISTSTLRFTGRRENQP